MKEIIQLTKSPMKKTIESRLKEFQSVQNENIFSELCFCILTGNAKAKTALAVQGELGAKGFLLNSEKSLVKTLLKNKHRFHNTKAKRIIEARPYEHIHQVLPVFENGPKAREWIVKNIKGLGYKESSHFLRNIGYTDVAIIDRHIIRFLEEEKLVRPKILSMTPKKYLQYERACQKLAKKLNMNLAELDLYMWYLKTGEVLK